MSDREEDSHLTPEEEKLEVGLRGLSASPLSPELLKNLVREYARIADAENSDVVSRTRPQWLLPATLVVTVGVFCVTSFLRFHPSESGSTAAVTFDTAPIISSDSATYSDFVPMSSEGILLNASYGGIEKSPAFGTRERLDLNFQDIDHWHNPETSTHIHIITPRTETLYIPVQAD